jgi:hypothetical protein
MNILSNIIVFLVLFFASERTYRFSLSKNWPNTLRVMITLLGFSIAMVIVYCSYIVTGFPVWMSSVDRRFSM